MNILKVCSLFSDNLVCNLKQKMNSGSLLRVSSALKTQVRNRSVQNWKRPNMNEYGVPTEGFGVVQARRHGRWNKLLAVGGLYFGATMAYCWQSEKTVFYTVPRHLIKVGPQKD